MTEDEEDAALEARYCSCNEFALGTATCPETGLPLCAACGLWRPEWIKCVQVGYDGTPKATVDTVCGRLRVFGEFILGFSSLPGEPLPAATFCGIPFPDSLRLQPGTKAQIIRSFALYIDGRTIGTVFGYSFDTDSE